MTFRDSFEAAVSAIIANKLRSSLTTLGVVIGVGSVIAMIGIAEGTKRQSLSRLEAMGSNLIVVFPQWGQGQRSSDNEAQSLKLRDVEAIRAAVPTASAVTGEVRMRVQVKASAKNERSNVTGALPEVEKIRNIRLKEGRFFTPLENASADKVCILGFDIYNRLFGDDQAVGSRIKSEQSGL